MNNYTPHQARYFAEQIKLSRSESTIDGLASAMSGVKVDLNPHQVDAALFAMKSPLSNGALLALLTATPLQNNLMELYGLTSLIDDHVFGDEKTFREMYVAVTNTDIRNRSKNDDGTTQTYNLKWKDAEAEDDLFLRKEDAFFQHWLDEAINVDLPAVNIRFNHTGSSRNISFFSSHSGLKGVLSIDKMSYDGIGEEEHLVYTVITEDGGELDDDLVNRLLELPGMISGSCPPESVQLIEKRKERLAMQQSQIENANRQYYLDECDKLDAYSEELKDGLEREIKDMRKEITAKKKEFKNSTNLPLDQMLALKDEINKLEKKRKEKQRDLYVQQDKIDADNERLQEEMKKKLEGKIVTEHIMTISFEIV